MRVGLCLDLRNPPRWREPWERFYARSLEQVEEAERLGIDSVWLTEHHFFEDGYLPQVLTFGAAVAARTERVRIGTGILIAPLHPAVDIAEQAAIVDVLSGGRLELGLGAGYRAPEFDAYGVDIKRRMRLLEQRILEVRELWESGRVTPPPIQSPPPLWAGVHGPKGARMAGRLGTGLLRLDHSLLEHYREGLREGGHPPHAEQVAGLVNLVVAEEPEAAWRRITPHLEYMWNSYAYYGAEGTPKEGGSPDRGAAEPVDAESLRSRGPEMLSPNFDVVTPDEAVSRLDAWIGDLDVVEVYFWGSIAGMPGDLVREHVELLATRVAPRLRERPPRQSPAKAGG